MGEFDGRVFVATSRDVYYLLAIPVEKQVRVDISHSVWTTRLFVAKLKFL